jgi:hypothetical protein
VHVVQKHLLIVVRLLHLIRDVHNAIPIPGPTSQQRATSVRHFPPHLTTGPQNEQPRESAGVHNIHTLSGIANISPCLRHHCLLQLVDNYLQMNLLQKINKKARKQCEITCMPMTMIWPKNMETAYRVIFFSILLLFDEFDAVMAADNCFLDIL